MPSRPREPHWVPSDCCTPFQSSEDGAPSGLVFQRQLSPELHLREAAWPPLTLVAAGHRRYSQGGVEVGTEVFLTG